MSLTVGDRLGPYEILGLLGAGGMGEVYRARDSRLGRPVAVKVIRGTAGPDSTARHRFELEARAVSALNHPNIVTIHDVGFHEGQPYIVCELLEGEKLSRRLATAPLRPKAALELGLQILSGLIAAHGSGIVHRDLKPDNLFITRDGRLKILDFGLAKLVKPQSAGGVQTSAPTVSAVTEPGAVVGTARYMSPEQVCGEPLDHRADLFSFGVVFYEMVAGEAAFKGRSGPEVTSAVLKDEPPPLPAAVQAALPGLEPIVRHCLEKDREQRFQSARDLSFALTTLARRPDPGANQPAARPRRRAVAAFTAAVLVAALGGFIAGQYLSSASAPSYRPLTFQRGTVLSARLAPDGDTVVYSAEWDGRPAHIFSTRPHSPESRPLDLKEADILAISPSGEMAVLRDRRYLGAWATRGTLARVPLAGGAPRDVLADVQEADWSSDGAALAVARVVGGKYRLEFPIGNVLYETTGWLSNPRLSGDGDLVAFIEHPVPGDDRGAICTIGADRQKRTLSDGWASAYGLAWSPGGDEVWFTAAEIGQNAALHAVGLSGRPRVVARSPGRLTIQDTAPDGRTLMTVSRLRLYMKLSTPDGGIPRDLSWLDTPVVTDLSADGRTVLFIEGGTGSRSGSYAVYMRTTDGAPAVRLGDGSVAALSPDGAWAAAIVLSPRPSLTLLPTGADQPRTLDRGDIANYYAVTWFPDGQSVLFAGSEQGRDVRLYVQDVRGGKPAPISAEGVRIVENGNPMTSDGEHVAAVDQTGRVLLHPTEAGEGRPIPGLDPGDLPIRWSPDGGSLFVFRRGDLPARVYRLRIADGRKELVTELIPSDSAGTRDVRSVLVTPDGKSRVFTYSQTLSDLYLVDGLR